MMSVCEASTELDREIRTERKLSSKKKPLSANAWRFNDRGSAEPASCSFERIFEAWVDYKQSLSWG